MHTSVVQLHGAGRRRGHYSDEFKRKVMAARKQPGVSMAAVALANGLNAKLLRRHRARFLRCRVRCASVRTGHQHRCGLSCQSVS